VTVSHAGRIVSVLLLAASAPSVPRYPQLADIVAPEAACDRWVAPELRDNCMQVLDVRRLA
jgi:hypothetical protein